MKEYKIAHRDIKPTNIILSANKKEYKLVDFGLSQDFQTEPDDIYIGRGTEDY